MNDEFAWLRNKSDPKVIDLLREENRRTETALTAAAPLARAIYDEILAKTKESDEQPPYRVRDHEYFSRTVAGKNYPLYLRRPVGTAGEELLLDLNALAAGREFMALGDFSVSPDGKLLAYTLDTDGSEIYAIYVKDLATGDVRTEVPGLSDGNVCWSPDQRHLFYLTLDDIHRPFRVFRHALGEPPARDGLLYEEKDPKFYLGIELSKDERVLFVESESKDSSEVRFLRFDDPAEKLTLMAPRRDGVLYEAYHREDEFLIVTNDGAENFRIMRASPDRPGRDHWTEWLPYDPTRRVESLEVFRGHVAIFERARGLKNIRLVAPSTMETHDLAFPDAAYTLDANHNERYEATAVRFSYESPLTPPTVFAYDMDRRALTALKRTEIPGGFAPERYALEYFTVPAPDGTAIPITLLRPRDFEKNGSAPLLLNGYGAYEISKEPYFRRSWFSLVDRGFTVAIAHIRGGGEMGRAWYTAGKLLRKMNSFTDFIAVAEGLVARGYTRAGEISIMGGSAGGLLMGAVVNLRPDLWKSVLALVPFVDVHNTMSDESLPLTITEYDEWGNPGEEPYGSYILSYSPYDNVKPAKHPAILATAGLNDPRVGYWEPAKWVQRLRQHDRGGNPILLKTDLESGHGGPSGRYDKIKEEAFCLSFVVHRSLS